MAGFEEDISGVFRVVCGNENGRKGVDYCVERNLFRGNIHFKLKYMYRLIWAGSYELDRIERYAEIGV